jgi:hypothetical protein
MADARNSSGNIRGGGAKQTGGGGRTAKGAPKSGGKNGSILGDLESSNQNDRSEAKRNLQMQSMSKQLASSVKAALMADHTEEEYEEFNIPLPDATSALKKLKAMKEFTKNWYDKDFREQWLQRVTQLWEEELRAEYQAAFAAAKAKASGGSGDTENEAMTIEELEDKIQSLEVGSDERSRLKKKLANKRKKQKAKKSKAATTNGDGDEEK